MAIRSAAVGTSTEPARLEVTTRLSQAYAAGLADCNPRYFDDAAEHGVIAPPAFCVSIEWPVFLALGGMEPLGASRENRLRGVHALQDSTFWRTIRPGDVLITTAKIVEVRATRAGAFVLMRLDTLMERNGECVVTSYSGSLYRDVAVDGPAVSIEGPLDFPEAGPVWVAHGRSSIISPARSTPEGETCGLRVPSWRWWCLAAPSFPVVAPTAQAGKPPNSETAPSSAASIRISSNSQARS
jgi:N-terminal half of MaoC dehydratase